MERYLKRQYLKLSVYDAIEASIKFQQQNCVALNFIIHTDTTTFDWRQMVFI